MCRRCTVCFVLYKIACLMRWVASSFLGSSTVDEPVEKVKSLEKVQPLQLVQRPLVASNHLKHLNRVELICDVFITIFCVTRFPRIYLVFFNTRRHL